MKASEYVDIGQFLRDSRDSLHVTVEQAAAALHIRAKYLKALENGTLDDLPGKAYIRGYIRNYAEFLRLDVGEVLDAYESLLANKGRDFFVPEPTLKQNLPSRRVVRWAVIGMVALYGYWYFDVHDRTSLVVNTAEIPQEFMQMLDKTSRAAMDKAWKNCMDSGDASCFIVLRSQTAIPQSSILIYDPSLKDISSKEP